MNKLIIVFMVLFLAFAGEVFADPGFSGGIRFQQNDTNTITASPTLTSTNLNVLTTSNPTLNNFNLTVLPLAPQYNAIQLQGTAVSNASPTAHQLYWYATATTNLRPMTVTAGTNITLHKTDTVMTISAAGTSLSGNEASGTMDFDTLAPHDLEPGSVDTTRHTVFLANTGNTAAIFGAQILPDDWDAASDLTFKLLVATPVTAAAATVTFQLQYQIIKAGNALYTSAGFTTVATFSKLLTSTTNAQQVTDTNLKIAQGSLAVGDRIHLVVKRAGSFAADTHTDNLHIVAIRGNYHR